MSPKYKLIYFDIKGLGECIKYIFAYKGIEYECETVILFNGKGPWNELKSTMPFGQLPVLEVDGERLYQSQAICQYLAVQYDLVTGNVWEDAQLVALGCAIQDFILRVARYYYEPNPETKKRLREERLSVMIPFYLERFENILKSKGDYFSEKNITWLDFYFVASMEAINGMVEEDLITGKYVVLEDHMQRIWSLPGIKEYISQRPPYSR